ncbi:hypothetical protein NBRC116188_14830 [Oceaniserpentilla sp. 4NH20-0058]|uniref:imelysin family protein n=1 Tax=Oceaniserpentilla sp. 4NH20-0058 TaxID=3127660 RepID=UPI003104CAE9
MITRYPVNIVCNVLIIISTISLSGCDKLFEPPEKVTPTKTQVEVDSDGLLSTSNLFVYTQMSDALSKAQELDSIITSFLHHPNPLALEEAQAAWIAAYSAYVKVSFFEKVPRFEKPQFREQDETYQHIQERLDSWPIEPGYIDYLPLYPLSGIVNDLTLNINQTDIKAQHGFSDLRFASLGFHPMEFLLFAVNGKRSARDFIPQENSVEVVSADTIVKEDAEIHDDATEGASESSEAHDHAHVVVNGPQNHNRRREYLRLLSGLIVKNLQKLTDRWEPAHGYYAKQWRQPKAAQKTSSLSDIYQVILDTMQNTLLEKHLQPLLTQNTVEDLRSPFSAQDTNNILDIIGGIESLFNMDNGFTSEIKKQNAESADKLTAMFQRLLTDAKRLPANLGELPLAKRKELLLPIQDKTLQLFEQLYIGADVLRLTVRPLPISTT